MPQPTMSKAGLVLQCGWAFNNDKVPKVVANVPMRYGSAFHELVAGPLAAGVPTKMPLDAVESVAERFQIDAVEELREHASAAYATLRAWLTGDNAWGANLLPAPKGAILVETAIAYDTRTGKARLLPPVDDNHVYIGVGRRDHPGTVDVAINLKAYGKRLPSRLRDAVLILDHKTGVSFDPPQESYQLKSLALAFSRLWGCSRAIVAINHAPRDGIPAVFADELPFYDLDQHAKKLKRAFLRIGDGSLRPGKECGYCPANGVCPAYGGSLASLTRDLRHTLDTPNEPLVQEASKALAIDDGRPNLDITTPEGMGATHMILQMIRRVDDEWSERIKQQLREGGPDAAGVRPDGQLTVLKVTERENLSLASIKRACKPKRAAEIEKMLRDEKCIEVLKREELRAVADR